MYNDFIGTLTEPNENESRIIQERKIPCQAASINQDYDFVRYGLPKGVVSFEKYKNERKLLIDHFNRRGFGTWPAQSLSPKFRSHVALFRVRLDFWEEFSKEKVFPKEEIYYRCLSEGPSFAERIKKMRQTCFRAFTSETNTDIDEDEFSENYKGYNSIIHERYLIHWDDTENVDDVKYAFMPIRRELKDEFRNILDEYWEDQRLDEIDWPSEFDMIGAIKNTKMCDPITNKTSLIREFWNDDIDARSPYYARRAVVPKNPGECRDTGIGDPSTVLKVKQLNSLARAISSKIPHSANCDGPTANARLKRVLKNNLFLHVDFKKFGLTFPRYMMNILIEKIQESSGLDLNHLFLEDFFIEMLPDKDTKERGGVYRTNRGTVLGWLDSINSICVCAILHSLAKELKFDFITFNDDVEISRKGFSSCGETLELLRLAVLAKLDMFDIPISVKKTFGSKCSVFLERYAYYGQYGLDMYKEQLTVDAYSKSCVTKHIWQAKMFFAAAEQWTKSEYAADRCLYTCGNEFRRTEKSLPLWSGGWFIRRENKLDLSLLESDRTGIRLGIELSKFKPPNYSVKPEKVSKNKTMYEKVNNLTYNSSSAEAGLLHHNWQVETIQELNWDVSYSLSNCDTWCDLYSGRDETFPEAVRGVVNKLLRGGVGWGG